MMIKFLFDMFVRSKGMVIAILLFLVFGLISLNIGKRFLEKKKENIAQVLEKKQENTEGNIRNNQSDLGLLLYYQKFGFINETPNIAGLSFGLRKTTPTIKDITIRNLEEQKYSSELLNPFYQLFGNMDFGFILIYFLPLVIIILCFNVLSEEKETKRWNMIMMQSGKPMKIIWGKILIRYFITILSVTLLLIAGQLYLNIPYDLALTQFIVVAVLYISFWFVLCCFIISFNNTSSRNLLYSLITWIIFSVVSPTVLSAITEAYFPVSETYQTAIKSREGYHTKWDEDKKPTMQKFHAEYPKFARFSHPKGQTFSWVWYYAMQHMGDVEARADSEQLNEKLGQRIEFMRAVGMFFPTIHAQLSFNRLTHSDLSNYLHFLEELEEKHEQLRLKFYPKVFTDNVVDKQDLTLNNTVAYYTEKTRANLLMMALPMIVGMVLLLIWARINFKKNILK